MTELETSLDLRLLTRSARGAQLTDAGRVYLARIEPILAALDDARASLLATGQAGGTLRISLPSSLAGRRFLRRLSIFLAENPKVQSELLIRDDRHDLLHDDVDVALRCGDLENSSATAKRIGHVPQILLASPDYLSSRKPLTRPEDLLNNVFLGSSATDGRIVSRDMVFSRNGIDRTISLCPQIVATQTAAVVEAARCGLGIVQAGFWAGEDYLDSGALISVLPDWTIAPHQLHAVFPLGRKAKHAAQCFVDALKTEFHPAQSARGSDFSTSGRSD